MAAPDRGGAFSARTHTAIGLWEVMEETCCNAAVERPPMVRFHARDILEEAKLLDGEKCRGHQGLGTGRKGRGLGTEDAQGRGSM